jgi:hypothetical protein
VPAAQDSRPYFAVSLETGPIIPMGIGFPFCRLLWLAWIWWKYSNPWIATKDKVILRPSVSQSTSVPWYEDQPPILSLSRKLSSDICGSFSIGCPLWWEDESVITRTSATGPRQRCHSRVQVPQNMRQYLNVSFETGFPFCRLLRLAETSVEAFWTASTRSEPRGAIGPYYITPRHTK